MIKIQKTENPVKDRGKKTSRANQVQNQDKERVRARVLVKADKEDRKAVNPAEKVANRAVQNPEVACLLLKK